MSLTHLELQRCYKLVRTLNELQEPRSVPGLTQACQAILGPRCSIQIVEETAANPAGFIAYTREEMVVGSLGVNTAGHTLSTLTGWSVLQEIVEGNGLNRYAATIAENVYMRGLRETAPGLHVNLVGHSLGGMIVTAIWVALQLLRPAVDLRSLVTFGAPRASIYPERITARTGLFARFMTLGDPVTFLPPRFEEFPALCAAYAGLEFPMSTSLLSQALNGPPEWPSFSVWPQFGHGPHGIALGPGGALQDTSSIPAAPDHLLRAGSPLTMVQTVLNVPEHYLANYADLMRQAVDSTRPPPLAPIPPAPAEPPPPPAPDVSFIIPLPDAEITLPTTPEEDMSEFDGSPQVDPTTLPTGDAGWALMIGQTAVALYASRRAANRSKVRFRKALESLGLSQEVIRSAMLIGIGRYLDEAGSKRGRSSHTLTVM